MKIATTASVLSVLKNEKNAYSKGFFDIAFF